MQTSPNTNFTDVQGHWGAPAINTLAQYKYVNGRDDGKFYPNDNITRAEAITMLMNAFRVESASDKSMPFTDCDFGVWYYKPIKHAYIFRLVNGVSETEFGVNLPITRQDYAVFLYRVANQASCTFSGTAEPFADENKIASYATTAITNLAGSKIINGREDGTFDPYAKLTRAEAAKMLYEAMYLFNLL